MPKYLDILNTATLVVAALICVVFAFLTVTVKVEADMTLYNFIMGWQTLFAAILALGGAYMTVMSIRHQINADNERERKERIASANVYIAACRNYLLGTCKAIEILNETLNHRTPNSDNSINFYYKGFLLVYREFPTIIDDWAYLSDVPHDVMLLLKDAKICTRLVHDTIRDVTVMENGTDILVRKAEWQDLCERIAPFVHQADLYMLRAEEKMGCAPTYYHYPDILNAESR